MYITEGNQQHASVWYVQNQQLNFKLACQIDLSLWYDNWIGE